MEKKLLMSGDIELNPGPVENSTNETSTTIPPHVRLEQRLRQFQLLSHISYMVTQDVT